MPATHADKIAMQHRLFAELSAMFGREVPLYDKSLLVNRVVNESVCGLLEKMYRGFSLTTEQLEKTSGERHGAIRIGTPEEYRLVAGFFAAFGMLPHNFYDMTALGTKSQPIIATAFRSPRNPEHRVFTSLLMIDYFDEALAARIQEALSRRQIFSARAKDLIAKNDRDGGLSEAESEELIREGTTRIFKWTGRARDHALYQELSEAGFRIAADIACFDSHHLNHLTPNTLCMDLYTAAMKFCLGEWARATFVARAAEMMAWLQEAADRDYMRLHFRHVSREAIDAFGRGEVPPTEIDEMAEALAERLGQGDLLLSRLPHSGFKDYTEGPPRDVPVLLRQDSYKALTEPVTFVEADGSTIDSKHTARFGEIEQRFYATTPKGRALYDRCLATVEQLRGEDPDLVKRDPKAYEAACAKAFAEFPRSLRELLKEGLVYGVYTPTEKGLAAAGSIDTTDVQALLEAGFVNVAGVRYEDFLPFSAAGIFASNLGQYGTQSTAAEKRTYSRETLEEIMGRTVIDPNVLYASEEAGSMLAMYERLGLLEAVDEEQRRRIRTALRRD